MRAPRWRPGQLSIRLNLSGAERKNSHHGETQRRFGLQHTRHVAGPQLLLLQESSSKVAARCGMEWNEMHSGLFVEFTHVGHWRPPYLVFTTPTRALCVIYLCGAASGACLGKIGSFHRVRNKTPSLSIYISHTHLLSRPWVGAAPDG